MRGTFETIAQLYDTARPSYPPALFDDLIALAELQPEASLLEIGCGTGKATRPLLERGFSVTCIESGTELAQQARRLLHDLPVRVISEPFESWEGPESSFDLVYAATAWHWVSPSLRYRKAHSLLRPGGHLAFWNAQHGFPVGFDPFFSEIQEVYAEIGEGVPGEEWPPPPPEKVEDAAAEIEASGLFTGVQVRRYGWAQDYTAEEYIALLNTFSGHISMPPDRRDHLYREIRQRISVRPNRRVHRHWLSILHVAAGARRPRLSAHDEADARRTQAPAGGCGSL